MSAMFYTILILIHQHTSLHFPFKIIFYVFAIVIIVAGIISLYFDQFNDRPILIEELRDDGDYSLENMGKIPVKRLIVQPFKENDHYQAVTVAQYNEKIEEIKKECDQNVFQTFLLIYRFIFLIVGPVIFFWAYNGIKGRQRERTQILC